MTVAAPDIRFLSATKQRDGAAIIIGVPLDLTESFRSGTAEAPRRVRAASEVLESYNSILDRDLQDLPLADWGDVSVGGGMEQALAAIAEATGEARSVGLPLIIGGEHTATLGAIQGIRKHYPDVFLIQLDAHLDLRDEYDGRQLSHATVMRRIADVIGLDRLIQLGVRSGTAGEFALARGALASSPDLRLLPEVRREIDARPVYLTIDIDVLDPCCAPGTGCPEPGGPLFADVQVFLHSLRGMNVIAMDVMEVLPAADVNDITSIAAAKLLRDGALLFA